MAAFVPERGDLIWLTFDPQAGHEQAGRRPALALSPTAYNQKVWVSVGLSNHEPGEGISV